MTLDEITARVVEFPHQSELACSIALRKQYQPLDRKRVEPLG